jgi:sugar O-acyltransferase (sialic acid O-acetyltransferase NeuD family)
MTLDILRAAGVTDAAFVDDAATLRGTEILGARVFGPEVLERTDAQVIVALGKPSLRLVIAARVAARGLKFANAIHPAATIMPSAMLGVGNIIGPQTVVDTEARLGDHCILNPQVLVGHDSQIGNAVTFAGGVAVGSRVVVGEGAFLCMCCDIVPAINIGAGAIVGAGALVMKNVPERILVMGSPARAVWRVDDKFDWRKVV